MSYTPAAAGDSVNALLFGTDWNAGAGGATITALSYSFAGAGSLWDASYNYGIGSEPATGFAPLSSIGQQAVRNALLSWSSVANLAFHEVADDASGYGTLRLGYTTLGMNASQLGYAYAPAESSNGGDVWLNAQLKDSLYSSFTPVSLSSYVVLHELGHTLGLKHPHAQSPANSVTLGSLEDSLFNSVMSYYAWPGVALTQTNIDRLPSTPMQLDIDALQTLYGANTSSHSGDDTYSYTGDGKYLETIFDTGGNDTIEVSGSRAAEIDLRPGEWSQLGVPVQINGGSIQNADTVRIYHDTAIENAAGGWGNDRLIGNDLANRLSGNAGNDTLTGGAGNDTLDGGVGTDSASFSGNRSAYSLTPTAGGYSITDTNVADGDEGTDTLLGIERLVFADVGVNLVMNVNFLAYDWKSHSLLGGVGISGADHGGTTDTSGGASFAAVTGAQLPLAVSRAVAADEADLTSAAVNLQDAIAILKLIVGLEVNGPGRTLSPYQALAADYDGNGQVQLTDAIGVLKHVAGLAAPTPAWHFASETDAAISQVAALSPGAPPAISIDLSTAATPAHVGLVAYLSGDVDGSYAGVAGEQVLDVVQSGYFEQLANATGLNLSQFGIY